MKNAKILVINGPNLNMVGIREPGVYGNKSLSEINSSINTYAGGMKIACDFFQSNCEGEIIDKIQSVFTDYDGCIINAGAYTHYSYAIHDALESVKTFPKIEIHISDINTREEFRRISVTEPACDGQVVGQGLKGYLMAIDKVLEIKEK